MHYGTLFGMTSALATERFYERVVPSPLGLRLHVFYEEFSNGLILLIRGLTPYIHLTSERFFNDFQRRDFRQKLFLGHSNFVTDLA